MFLTGCISNLCSVTEKPWIRGELSHYKSLIFPGKYKMCFLILLCTSLTTAVLFSGDIPNVQSNEPLFF